MSKVKNITTKSTCVFRHLGAIGFAETADVAEKNGRFSIVGYSGEIIPNHFYWGNLAFDLKGLSFAKDRIPVMEEHYERIGFSTKHEITDKVLVEGSFLSNDAAQQMRKDLKDGCPMEASLYVPPSIIERVSEGESVEVNGQLLKGPGTVFRKATIKEVSMCVFGADSQTASTAFADGGKQEINFTVLEKEITMDKVKFAAEHPDLLKQVQDEAVAAFKATAAKEASDAKAAGLADGVKAEKERFGKFCERFKDDAAFCVEQFNAGKSLDEATVAYAEKLKVELAKSKEQKPADKKDPATTEFTDTQTAPAAPAVPSNEAEMKAKFEKDKALQEEFGDVNTYIAYLKADANGQVSQPKRPS